MNEQQATALAHAVGGDVWQSGGDIWLVTIRRSDGRLVVLSEDAVCLYPNEDAFDRGDAEQAIELHI